MAASGKLGSVLFYGTAAIGCAGALVWAALGGRLPGEHGGALSAIPASAMVVVSVDLDKLRASQVAAPLVREGRELPGIGRIGDACGFDPVSSLHEIALAVPSGEEGELGIAAVGDVKAEALVLCARKIVERRGGKPVVEKVSSFTVVRDARADVGGHIAVRDGGPVLLAGAAYVREMIRAAEHAIPSASASREHLGLRQEAGEGSAIVATAVLPPELKRKVRAEMGDAPALAISSVAGAITLEPVVRVRALARCDDAAACDSLAAKLNESKNDQAKDLGARLFGLGAILDRVSISSSAGTLEAKVEIAPEDATRLVERLSALRGLRRPEPPHADPPPARPVPPPDEIVKPR